MRCREIQMPLWLRPVAMMAEPQSKGALLEQARTLVREMEV
ncbi:hypothetical protein [Planctomicrobium sp. SH664]